MMESGLKELVQYGNELAEPNLVERMAGQKH